MKKYKLTSKDNQYVVEAKDEKEALKKLDKVAYEEGRFDDYKVEEVKEEKKMRNFIVDLCSFNIEAETYEEAQEKAIKMVKEDGWAEIDQILEETEEEIKDGNL